MTTARVIRYTTKPDRADENEGLILDVFAELATTNPEGLRYTALRLDDGVSFVHVAVLDGEHNALFESPAFAKFQADIADRLESGPETAVGSVVGAYGPPLA